MGTGSVADWYDMVQFLPFSGNSRLRLRSFSHDAAKPQAATGSVTHSEPVPIFHLAISLPRGNRPRRDPGFDVSFSGLLT